MDVDISCWTCAQTIYLVYLAPKKGAASSCKRERERGVEKKELRIANDTWLDRLRYNTVRFFWFRRLVAPLMLFCRWRQLNISKGIFMKPNTVDFKGTFQSQMDVSMTSHGPNIV